MDPITLIVKIVQDPGEPAIPLDTIIDAIGNAADATVKNGEVTILTISKGQSLKEQMPGVFSDADTPEAKATIPYQERATLVSSTAGQYMDVVGNDGRVLCSFEKPDVRRVWGEMNR